ncbi:MAG: hypothetical protein M9894_11100 [Planctomycetes bacterium]|nr:hypothetical protein [Planctomycetota bacterium]
MILTLIMVCSVVGLLRASSGAIDRIASSKALCAECPDAVLTGDELEEYHRLRAAKARAEAEGAERLFESDADEAAYYEYAERRARDLRIKREAGTFTESDAHELAALEDDLSRRPNHGGENGVAPARPGVLGMFDSLFGPGWENTWAASLMGIFGWFSFFV